jgi:hypothetical protein
MAKMRDEELVALCEAEITVALGASGGDISKSRADALDRYLRKPLGNEVAGRSQVRTGEVADTIEWILPSLMRIFTDADNAVEFAPQGPEDEDAAKQETDRVAYEVYNRNPGFLRLYMLMKDALLSKVGIAKVVWDEEETTERETYQHLLDIELQALLADTSVKREILDWSQDESGISVSFATTRKRGRVDIQNVPPEEYGQDNRTSSLDPADCYFAYHETKLTRSELIEEGYDRKLVDDLPADDEVEGSEEDSRNEGMDDAAVAETLRGMERITITECYIRADRNDDGIAELLKVTLAGGDSGREILEVEETDAILFVALTPVPIPHRFCGLSVADLVMDIQEIKTAILRQNLDSMYLSNNPQTAISNRVSIPDMQDRRVGGLVPVDTEQPDVQGHFAPIIVPSMGQEGFGMLEYMDSILRQRTGVGDEVMGLDASSLSQIQTTALAQAYDAARMRIEMIARIFAETGIKALFLRTHELLQKHQDKAEVVKLRNRWVQVNPAEWRTRENVNVRIGVGNSSQMQRQAALQQIIGLQQTLAQAGAMGQLLTPEHMYKAVSDMVEALGMKDPSLYFADPKQMPPKQPPPPDPKLIEVQMKAQIEQAKVQIDQQRLQIEAAKLQQSGQVDQLQMALKTRESELKAQIEQLKAQSAMQKQIVDERSQVMNAQANAAKLYSDANTSQMQQRIDLIEAEKDRALEAYKAQLDAAVRLQIEDMKAQASQVMTAQAEQAGAAAEEKGQRDGEVVATLYERIEALTEALREMEEERKAPLEFERDETTGRAIRVGGREVVRGPDGRVLRLQ